jgi:hypothetical protein
LNLRSDGGHAGIELALGVGLLMLPAALLVLGFGPWSERAVLAEAVAAEASRAAVLGLSVAEGNEVAVEMGANYGLESAQMRVGWCGSAPVAGGGGDCSFDRGSLVSVEVSVWVPLVSTPWGTIGGIWIDRNHAEFVDVYRSLG